MVDPVGVEEGKNSSQKEQGASSKVAWNMRLRIGGMIGPAVTLCVCLRGS